VGRGGGGGGVPSPKILAPCHLLIPLHLTFYRIVYEELTGCHNELHGRNCRTDRKRRLDSPLPVHSMASWEGRRHLICNLASNPSSRGTTIRSRVARIESLSNFDSPVGISTHPTRALLAEAMAQQESPKLAEKLELSNDPHFELRRQYRGDWKPVGDGTNCATRRTHSTFSKRA